MQPKNGQLDITINYDTNTGEYRFRVEENGLPTEVPSYVVIGILELAKGNIIVDGALRDMN